MDPGVQQDVARAAVEPVYGPPRLDQAQVAEAAYVQYRTMAAGVAEQGLVEGRNQWRALAASGDIAPAEITDHGNAGELSQESGVADLDGETAGGLVAHGLAVAADGADVLGAQTIAHQQGIDPRSGQFDPALLGQCGAGEFVGAGCAKCQQLAA
ncbi:hypothetical protein D3C84_907280 [compost metagenome]